MAQTQIPTTITYQNLASQLNTMLGELYGLIPNLQPYATTAQVTSAISAAVSGVVGAAPTNLNDLGKVATAIQALQTLLNNAVDNDNFVNSFQDVLTLLQNFAEGTDLAGVIADKVGSTAFNTAITNLQNSLSNYVTTADFNSALANKVDKVQGKVLSTEDYTTAEKNKLASVPNFTYDTALTPNSTNLINSGNIFSSLLTGGAIPANLVTSVTPGNLWAATGVLTPTSGYKAVNLIPAKPGDTFAIQGLARNNTTASFVGRALNSAGTGINADIPRGNLTQVSGGYLLTVPSTPSTIAQIALFFEDGALPNAASLIIQAGNTVITSPQNVAIKTALLPNNGVYPFKSSDLSNDKELVSISDLNTIINMPTGVKAYFNKGAAPKTVSNTKPIGILSAGQSNQDGRIPIASLPAWWNGSLPGAFINNSDTLNWHNYDTSDFVSNQFSYELLLYKMILDNQRAVAGHTADNIYIVKKTLGGTAIDPVNGDQSGSGFWTADYESIASGKEKLLLTLESRWRAAANSVNASLFDLRCMIWHQGEADRSSSAAANYYTNLKNLIYYVRGFTGKPNLPIILGAINTQSAQYNAIVEAAKQQLVSENPGVIFYASVTNTTSNLQSDLVHFNYAGGLELATNMFAIMTANKALFGLL